MRAEEASGDAIWESQERTAGRVTPTPTPAGPLPRRLSARYRLAGPCCQCVPCRWRARGLMQGLGGFVDGEVKERSKLEVLPILGGGTRLTVLSAMVIHQAITPSSSCKEVENGTPKVGMHAKDIWAMLQGGAVQSMSYGVVCLGVRAMDCRTRRAARSRRCPAVRPGRAAGGEGSRRWP